MSVDVMTVGGAAKWLGDAPGVLGRTNAHFTPKPGHFTQSPGLELVWNCRSVEWGCGLCLGCV